MPVQRNFPPTVGVSASARVDTVVQSTKRGRFHEVSSRQSFGKLYCWGMFMYVGYMYVALPVQHLGHGKAD